VTVSTNLPVPARALAIGAHPDDVEIRCGATLARWAAAGCAITHLICTDGSKGTWDLEVDPAALVATRREEQAAAARALGGAGSVLFLDAVDGELDATLELRGDVARIIRQTRPGVVLGHDPWRRYRLHPDHRHAGFLAVEGIVAARDPQFFREQGLQHHRPDALLLFEADEPDHVEVADERHVAVKIGAIEAHRSQLRSTMFIDEAAPDAAAQRDAFQARVRAKAAAHGSLAGAAYGEAFKLMHLDR
jgi:LmbE family N-acetylglucosaminyl deacetylase